MPKFKCRGKVKNENKFGLKFETSDEWYSYVILQTLLKNQPQVKVFSEKIQNINSVQLIILI